MLKSYLLISLVAFSFLITNGQKLTFKEINAPSFYMGDDLKQPNPDYSKLVITYESDTELDRVSQEIERNLGLKKAGATFDEFNAIVYNVINTSNKKDARRVIRKILRNKSVSCVYPFYELDGGELYYFNVINFQYKDGVTDSDVNDALLKNGAEWMKEKESRFEGGVSFCRVQKGKSIFEVSKALRNTGLFKYVYPMSNRIVYEEYTPNDTDYSSQWHLNQANDADIDAPEAWDITTGDNNIVIAVAELNGFDVTHPDIVGNITDQYNAFLDNNSAQYLDDAHTHGTKVIGSVGASTDNNLYVSGVCFNVMVMPIILTSVDFNSVSAATLQRAADHIIANGKVVAVTNSWSGSSFDALENDQFQRMRTLSRDGLGSVIMASSGNYSNTDCRYPACYPNVLSVGRTGQTDEWYSSSNYNDSLDIAAPGSSIFTLDPVGPVGASGNVTTSSGTSYSCPIAAGVVGLMASVNPLLPGEQLKDFLEQSCDKVGGYPYATVSGRPNGTWVDTLGYGRVNAYQAVLLADAFVDLASSSNPFSVSQVINDIDITTRVTNVGSNNVGSFEVEVYLSTSPTFATLDHLLASETFSGLSTGATDSIVLTIDACNLAFPEGTYYLGHVIDANDDIVEGNESNNIAFTINQPIVIECDTSTYYTLSVDVSPQNSGLVAGSGTYLENTSVSIQTVPNNGWTFLNWTENGSVISTNSTTNIVMTANRSIVANYIDVTSSVSNQLEDAAVTIFPNPAKDNFTISLSQDLLDSQYAIYNTSGQLITQNHLLETDTEINFSQAAGIYYINFSKDNASYFTTVLVKE